LKDDVARTAVEAFIRDRFAVAHHAQINHFLPELLALQDHHGKLAAAVGARLALDERLFIEQYLQNPIEQAVSLITDGNVERRQIVEVGNLASRNAGNARLIIVAMTWLLARQGLEWVVFTGAATLINSFQRLGLDPLLLCDADPTRLAEGQEHWGSYYDKHPQVFVGNIRYGLEQLETSGVLARLGFPHCSVESCHAA
ncbi:MAG: thermostable hemolysin, partial [Pseudomonas sp.]